MRKSTLLAIVLFSLLVLGTATFAVYLAENNTFISNPKKPPHTTINYAIYNPSQNTVSIICQSSRDNVFNGVLIKNGTVSDIITALSFSDSILKGQTKTMIVNLDRTLQPGFYSVTLVNTEGQNCISPPFTVPDGQAFQNLTFVDADYWYQGMASQTNWTWTLSLTLKNTGNVNAIIDNITVNGQLYNNFKTVPGYINGRITDNINNITILFGEHYNRSQIVTIDRPSVNEYILLPNLSITVRIEDTNATVPLLDKESVISVGTIGGNSYSKLLGS
jgi:hypothetical protein